MHRPEKNLKDDAFALLGVIFDPSSDEDEVQLSAITLAEIIAPEIVADAARYHLLDFTSDGEQPYGE